MLTALSAAAAPFIGGILLGFCSKDEQGDCTRLALYTLHHLLTKLYCSDLHEEMAPEAFFFFLNPTLYGTQMVPSFPTSRVLVILGDESRCQAPFLGMPGSYRTQVELHSLTFSHLNNYILFLALLKMLFFLRPMRLENMPKRYGATVKEHAH